MQALSDLLALPVALMQHVQQELVQANGAHAIGLMRPGHCIWHVKRLSKFAKPIAIETFENSAPVSSVE